MALTSAEGMLRGRTPLPVIAPALDLKCEVPAGDLGKARLRLIPQPAPADVPGLVEDQRAAVGQVHLVGAGQLIGCAHVPAMCGIREVWGISAAATQYGARMAEGGGSSARAHL